MTDPLHDLPVPSGDWAWFLDVDGTLLEIAPSPDAVVVTPALRDRLSALRDRSDGAVALVSGRALADLDRLFRPLVLPAAGQHGLERRRADGTVDRAATSSPELDRIRAELAIFAQAHPGTLVEDKGSTVALHYRNAPDAAEAAARLVDRLMERFGERHQIQPGKMVYEVKPRGFDKGTAIHAFMAEPPFAGRRPVFVGDDATDEHGFEVVNALGGISIQVGDRSPTQARFRVADVTALGRWLERRPG